MTPAKIVAVLLSLLTGLFGMGQLFGQDIQRQPTFLVRTLVFDRPDMMMRQWYESQLDQAHQRWLARYDELTDIGAVERYQKRALDFFLRQLDLPKERTALNAQITGRLSRKEFRVEKIVFESLPGFYVTAALFLPLESKYKAPYPAAIVACGHSENGKASEAYQRVCMLGAMNGLATLIVDPIDQGDRLQHLGPDKKPYAVTVKGHNMAAIGGIPIGRSTATIMMWDLMRGIDYLQSRPDIIPTRIGAMGNSGGGTQSAYLMALDKRVVAAAPTCYVSSLTGKTIRTIGPPDDEQLIFDQLGFGLEHADYSIIRAPRPTLLCTATRDFFRIEDSWSTFRLAKRVYGRFGLGERMDLVETDMKHGYSKQLREGGIRWMLRWLANRDEAIVEDDTIPVFTDDELRCVPAPGVYGQTKSKTAYDIHRERAEELTALRQEQWKKKSPEQAAELIRRVAKFRALDAIPSPAVRSQSPTRSSAALESEPGIFLPVKARWKANDELITIVLDDNGRESDFVNKMFAQTKGDVLAVDLRGWGETQGSGGRHSYPEWFGLDRNEFYFAFALGRTYVGMRTEDLFSVIRYCQNEGKTNFRIIARGGAETIALHAAVSEPGLFEEIRVVEPLPDWNKCVENAPCGVQLTDYVYGALKEYDKSDLRKLVKIVK